MQAYPADYFRRTQGQNYAPNVPAYQGPNTVSFNDSIMICATVVGIVAILVFGGMMIFYMKRRER
jgi:hypothetical protein